MSELTGLEKERLSRRWTMAKRIFYGILIPDLILLVAFISWDNEKAKIFIDGTSTIAIILASGIVSLLGIESAGKLIPGLKKKK